MAEQITVKSVWTSFYGREMLSHGCIDIESDDGRWFRGLSEMWRKRPTHGDIILVDEYGYSFPGENPSGRSWDNWTK